MVLGLQILGTLGYKWYNLLLLDSVHVQLEVPQRHGMRPRVVKREEGSIGERREGCSKQGEESSLSAFLPVTRRSMC